MFYVYALISFALLRASFDADDMMYCATLWQCTVTVIRYGLVGDIFDVSTTLDNLNLLPPANEACEGYVFTGVCLSTRGGMRGCRGGCVVVGGQVWLQGGAWLWAGMCGCGGVCGCGGHVWLWGEWGACVVVGGGMHRIRRDTVNERAVRILLECILVCLKFQNILVRAVFLCKLRKFFFL